MKPSQRIAAREAARAARVHSRSITQVANLGFFEFLAFIVVDFLLFVGVLRYRSEKKGGSK